MRNTTHPNGHGRRIHHELAQGLLAVAVLTLAILLPPAAISGIHRASDQTGDRVAMNLSRPDFRPNRNHASDLRRSAHLSERELSQVIMWFAREHKLPQALIRAVIQAESGFNPVAVSPTGALGLMQLMPRTAASLDVRDPFNPVENIRGGAKYLRYLLDRFDGNLPLALAAYNAGEYRVKRNNYQIPAIQETQQYVEKVLFYYRAFKAGKRPPEGIKRMF